jgi:O-methyltransferase domain
LAAILAANASLRGILFDQVQVVAQAGPIPGSRGVADRCQVIGGNFLANVPHGAAVYLSKSVLHDWDDEQAVRILKSRRAAMKPGGRILVVEGVLEEPSEPDQMKFTDLRMLVMSVAGANGRLGSLSNSIPRQASGSGTLFARRPRSALSKISKT